MSQESTEGTPWTKADAAAVVLLLGIIETLLDITGVESPADLAEWASDASGNSDAMLAALKSAGFTLAGECNQFDFVKAREIIATALERLDE